ncbi:MAG TPA: 3'-5' exonuclease [Thermodesulfovibrionales bacterium]|nr:3'-5' exonuclease [Thermodesulfovibrionales bacterium]
MIDETLPVGKVRYVIIDTELTGLDEKRDSIVSMAAIRMVGGRIDFGDVFYKLVNPETELTAKSIIIHGITPSDVVEKPEIATVLSEFVQFCGNDVVVGHCISVDLAFINREMKRILGYALKNEVLDTSAIYEWIRKRYSSQRTFPSRFTDSGLFDIAEHFGVSVTGAHNAAMDAFITAQVFQRFIPMLTGGGINSIGDLLGIGNPSKGGDRTGHAIGMYTF